MTWVVWAREFDFDFGNGDRGPMVRFSGFNHDFDPLLYDEPSGRESEDYAALIPDEVSVAVHEPGGFRAGGALEDERRWLVLEGVSEAEHWKRPEDVGLTPAFILRRQETCLFVEFAATRQQWRQFPRVLPQIGQNEGLYIRFQFDSRFFARESRNAAMVHAEGVLSGDRLGWHRRQPSIALSNRPVPDALPRGIRSGRLSTWHL